MEDLQTDTLCSYNKDQSTENADFDSSKDNEASCAASLLKCSDEIDELMENCENESIGSPNSDVWKGSDSEEETPTNFSSETEPKCNETEKELAVESVANKEIENLTKEFAKKAEMEKELIEELEKDVETYKENPRTINENSIEERGETTENFSSYEEAQNKDTNSIQEVLDNQETHNNDKIEEIGDNQEKQMEDQIEETVKNKEKEGEDRLPEEQSDSVIKEIIEVNKKSGQEKEKDDVNQQAVEEKLQTVPEKNQESDQNKNNESDKGNEEVVEKNMKDQSANETASKQANGEINEEVVCVQDKDPLDITSDPVTSESALNADDCRNGGERDEMDDDDDDDFDDDFDPSLLCPEVSMAVDDNLVITNGTGDGRGSSPPPYETSFSTFVDEVTGAEISFNLTPEEQELKRRLYGPTNPIEMGKIHCTACNVHLGSSLEGQTNRFVHPLLKVLICKECYTFYTSGDFDKDEDGSELYCRWCGQGGQVLCCSKCEFVFCKRCIRTNFGRRKMFEIRDSDSWECFRCNQPQISTQRVACYEFFEYVRRERSRAATLPDSEIWSKDLTRCCSNAKKKDGGNEQDKLEKQEKQDNKKKKKKHVDPDYNPLAEKLPEPVVQPVTPLINVKNLQTLLNRPIHIMPKANQKKPDNDIEFVRAIPPPQMVLNPINRPTTNMNVRPSTNMNVRPTTNMNIANFRAIVPNVRPVLQPPALVRVSGAPPLVPTSSSISLESLLQTNKGPTFNNASANLMKHEWFEKTVRAAARVNSHLSYTLTQLNKAQSQANSVEELAVVHNKLQEVLSSSVNSLMQIRKNLRTEFITGIKTVRLPTRRPIPENIPNDDDVIFVSAPPNLGAPSTLQFQPPVRPMVFGESTSRPTNSINGQHLMGAPTRPLLKVKSVMELQNVPSECITIPDDPPLRPPISDKNQSIPEKQADREKSPDVEIVSVEKQNTENTSGVICNGTKSSENEENPNRKRKLENISSVNEPVPLPEIKRMKSVIVRLERVDLKKLQKRLSNNL